jgi:hypothetical protein
LQKATKSFFDPWSVQITSITSFDAIDASACLVFKIGIGHA